MHSESVDKPVSTFGTLGLAGTIKLVVAGIADLYLADEIPWVIGYSGGKDSTATLQLVWAAVQGLSPNARKKSIHVISTDTLVENPIVSDWVGSSLKQMEKAAKEQGLPIFPHRLTPELKNTFWINLIGKGYPAPRAKFRWCTERLKITPSTQFIRSVVQKHGEAILVLGSRKAESSTRALVMKHYESLRVRDRLSPNGSLPNSFIFTPIEDWSNDDVWQFIMEVDNPWGINNQDLFTMYRGATPDAECPLVVDSSSPSCGDSRFGCWVCTLVEKDKSMQAMIQNDDEKGWMSALLAFRDQLASLTSQEIATLQSQGNEVPRPFDRYRRDFRRMHGGVTLFHDAPIPGPYTQKIREDWLFKLLQIQGQIQREVPSKLEGFQLITIEELEEIRRIWVVEKHELEDNLPKVYREATGQQYPGRPLNDNPVLGAMEMEILQEICQGDALHFQLTRELLSIEKRYRSMLKRSGMFQTIDEAFQRGYYDDEADAIEHARLKNNLLEEAREEAMETADKMRNVNYLKEVNLEYIEEPLP